MMCSRGLALAAALLLAASPVTAQVLRGTVQDSVSNEPLAGAHVTVLDARGAALASAMTGADGSFTFRLPVGSYQVRVRRIGFASRITQPIAVDSHFASSVQVVLPPNPVPLDTIRVVAGRVVTERLVPWLADAGFYHRRHMGFGTFLDRAEIEKKHALVVPDLLRDVPGVEVNCQNRAFRCYIYMPGARTMFIRKTCSPSVVLDGVLVSAGGTSGTGGATMDWPDVPNLEAIEIYPSPAGLPVQYSGYLSPCGAILLWTRR